MLGRKNERLFSGHYNEWRKTRIAKLVSIFGKDFFDGKDILELGCGWGDIGEKFIEMGATVTFCDVRQEHLDEVKKRMPNSITHMIDQDQPWNLDKKFDFVIHTGVLYHLSNWKQDLLCTLKHSNLIFLETVVSNNRSDSFEKTQKENGWDQSPHNISKRPSAAYIEKFLTEQGVSFERYDDADINAYFHRYDWVVGGRLPKIKMGSSSIQGAPRRFWILRK
ncbi:hypothetical protein LCGC14_2055140 [marine sediment metagenome]|uniref:Methyltransferase domain-containing protein n=1 Tax=marine sediment metagenome TaxID=412755 RepID=A0A0F9EMY5_9ZZZZ